MVRSQPNCDGMPIEAVSAHGHRTPGAALPKDASKRVPLQLPWDAHTRTEKKAPTDVVPTTAPSQLGRKQAGKSRAVLVQMLKSIPAVSYCNIGPIVSYCDSRPRAALLACGNGRARWWQLECSLQPLSVCAAESRYMSSHLLSVRATDAGSDAGFVCDPSMLCTASFHATYHQGTA